MRIVSPAGATLGAALLVACSPEGVNLVVDLTTDFVPEQEFDEIVLRDDGGATEETRLPASRENDYLGRVRIAELGPLERGAHRVEVGLEFDEVTVVERTLVVDVQEDSVVTVILSRSCRAVTCEGNQTCIAGRCQSLECTPEQPERCAGPECEGDDDCAIAGGCRLGRCATGVCLVALDESLCNEDEVCDAELDCVSGGSSACPPVDEAAIALFSFDEDATTDATGNQVASSVGTPTNASSISGCGSALRLDGSSYVTVDDSEDFDLASGSVDIWFRSDAIGREAIFSRDGSGGDAGHLVLGSDDEGRILVRMQSADGTNHFRCTPEPVAVTEWTHVGVNWGPPDLELWVNGERALTDELPTNTWIIGIGGTTCDVPLTEGLNNDEAWVLGGNTAFGDGPRNLMEGALDHFRVSGQRRDFSVYSGTFGP